MQRYGMKEYRLSLLRGIEGIDEIEGIEGIDEIEGIEGIDEIDEILCCNVLAGK